MARTKNPEKLRSEIDHLLADLGLQHGWRNHLCKVLKCHPSTFSNAFTGVRTGPREIHLLYRARDYLLGLNEYYRHCVDVNTKNDRGVKA